MPYALITGASKGIGKAIAAALAARKCDLLLVARSESLLKETAADLAEKYGVQTDYLATDLAATGASDKIMDWLEAKGYEVNILINNAGYGLSGNFDAYTAEEHKAMMQVNMVVPVELTARLIPALKKHPRSYIVNIASSAAYQAVPGLTVYAASKSFLLSFSRGLQYELRKTNISVTAVSPGGTDTDFANRAQVSAKAVRAGEKLNMTPTDVARIAVNAMYGRKTEVITGLVNKLGAAFAWLLPKKLTESTAASLYKKD
jgi:short-subunit dehydrogenase